MSLVDPSMTIAAFNDIVKQGYMKIKSGKIGAWKKKWIILRKKSSRGPNRIEKFADEKSSMLTTDCKKVLLDSGVSEIVRVPVDIRPHCVSITFQDGASKCLAAESEHEINDWFLLLKDLAQPDPNRDELDWMVSEAQKDTFHVFMLPSNNLQFYGECVLRVTTENIILLNYHDHSQQIVAWRLNTLRRYGRDQSKFTFEAGRASRTGEGLFIFNTTEGENIYKKVNRASIALVELGRLQTSMDSSSVSENGNHPSLNRMQSAPVENIPDGATCINNNLHHSKSLPSGRSLNDGVPPNPPPRLPDGSPPPPPPMRRGSNTSLPSPTRYVGAPGPAAAPPAAAAIPPLPPMRPARLGSTSSSSSDTALLLPGDQGAAASNQEPIYEEKYLTPAFRNFLAGRRDEDPGTDRM